MTGTPGGYGGVTGPVPGIAGTDSTPSVCVQQQGEQKSRADLAPSAGGCSPSPAGGSRVSFVMPPVSVHTVLCAGDVIGASRCMCGLILGSGM